MEKELADLKERYRRTEGFFRGATPTVEEWRAYCELYDSLKEATAQNAYFTSIPQNTARLTKLRATFAAGVPTEAILARMDHDVETVRELRVRSATLRERCESDPQLKRFVNGVPEEERLTRMKARLQHAVARKKAMEELPTDAQVRTKLPTLPIGIILAAVGALLVILSMIPAVAAVMLPLIIAGGALLVGGAVCLALGLHRRSKQLRKIAELSAKRRAWGKEIEENLAAVHAFLKEYRMSTDDPVRSMTELSLYASRADMLYAKHAAVPVITVHQAKGCEFNTVILAGVSERFFPSALSKGTALEDEEKKVFYVAITRPKERLIMTRVTKDYRTGERIAASPYAFKIPAEYLNENNSW